VGVVKFFWMHFYLTGTVEMAEKEKIIFIFHFHFSFFISSFFMPSGSENRKRSATLKTQLAHKAKISAGYYLRILTWNSTHTYSIELPRSSTSHLKP
jgi:hypothetical protein